MVLLLQYSVQVALCSSALDYHRRSERPGRFPPRQQATQNPAARPQSHATHHHQKSENSSLFRIFPVFNTLLDGRLIKIINSTI